MLLSQGGRLNSNDQILLKDYDITTDAMELLDKITYDLRDLLLHSAARLALEESLLPTTDNTTRILVQAHHVRSIMRALVNALEIYREFSLQYPID
jgi:hypothetical protein